MYVSVSFWPPTLKCRFVKKILENLIMRREAASIIHFVRMPVHLHIKGIAQNVVFYIQAFFSHI